MLTGILDGHRQHAEAAALHYCGRTGWAVLEASAGDLHSNVENEQTETPIKLGSICLPWLGPMRECRLPVAASSVVLDPDRALLAPVRAWMSAAGREITQLEAMLCY